MLFPPWPRQRCRAAIECSPPHCAEAMQIRRLSTHAEDRSIRLLMRATLAVAGPLGRRDCRRTASRVRELSATWRRCCALRSQPSRRTRQQPSQPLQPASRAQWEHGGRVQPCTAIRARAK
eukprot:scaffold123923_cov32-Tisochrysis_lutea.AAC.4